MMRFLRVFFYGGLVVLVGCANKPIVAASTPRTIVVTGSALQKGDSQRSFDLAEAECTKYGRHAALAKIGGSKLEAVWSFDCVL